MSCGAYDGRPEGQSVPYYVNGQYYYDYKQDYGWGTTDPRLLEFSEDSRDLHSRRHKLIHKIFPHSRNNFRAVTRSLNNGSACGRCWGLGGDGDEDLRLERFKVKTVDLEDEEVGAFVRGGSQGGPPVTTTTAYSKR